MNKILRTKNSNLNIINFVMIIGVFVLLTMGCQQANNLVSSNTANSNTATNSNATATTNATSKANSNSAATTDSNANTTSLSKESVEPENRAIPAPFNQPATTPRKMTVTQATTQEKEEIFQLFKKNDDEIEDRMLKSFTVRKMDLNSDGQPEYVAVLEDDTICGNLGNCPQSIYDKKGGEYNVLLESRSQVIKLEKNSTKGYLDVRTELSNGASSGFYYIYKFNGKRYLPSKCVEITYDPKEKETTINCDEVG